MKILKFLLASVALSVLCFNSALARDRVDVDINFNAYRYVAPQISHYPNTVYYSRTPTVIYYSAPEAVQIVPIITPQSNLGVNRYHGRDQIYSQNYYRDWSQGWRQNSGRGQFYAERGRGNGRDRCENRNYR